MFRVRGEIPSLFTGEEDKRAMFFTDGQTLNLDKIDDQSNGYFVEKWTNLTDAGETASNTADGGVNTDYPLFRLADVYLMIAEAFVIRYGVFTTNGYLWQWKGGVKEGTAVNSRYNIYPIPTTELTANPNLYNENY